MTQDNGGQAFPRPGYEHLQPDGKILHVPGETGMTLLDYFAGQAVGGLLKGLHDRYNIARLSYDLADAMLAEKRRREETK